MSTIAMAICGFVAILHVVFMLAETIGWDQMSRRFGYSKEQTEATRVLAANQGIYNGALAASLIWFLVTANVGGAATMLAFVVAVGIYGGATVRWTILVAQVIPASIGLAAIYLT